MRTSKIPEPDPYTKDEIEDLRTRFPMLWEHEAGGGYDDDGCLSSCDKNAPGWMFVAWRLLASIKEAE